MITELENRLALRPKEAARLMGLSASQVYLMLRRNELPFKKAGSATLISVEALKKWLIQDDVSQPAAGGPRE